MYRLAAREGWRWPRFQKRLAYTPSRRSEARSPYRCLQALFQKWQPSDVFEEARRIARTCWRVDRAAHIRENTIATRWRGWNAIAPSRLRAMAGALREFFPLSITGGSEPQGWRDVRLLLYLNDRDARAAGMRGNPSFSHEARLPDSTEQVPGSGSVCPVTASLPRHVAA